MIICLGPVCVPIWGLLPLVLYFFPKFGAYLDRAPAWVQWCCRGRASKQPAQHGGISRERQSALDPAARGASGQIFEVQTPEEFEYLRGKVCGAGRLLLADWGATWCDPCREMEPMVSTIAKKHAECVVVAKLDLDKLQAFSSECRVSAVPTFVVYGAESNGEGGSAGERMRMVGASASELEQKVGALAASAKKAIEKDGSENDSASAADSSLSSALIKCDVDAEYADAVMAAIREYRARESGNWSVSACRSVGRSGDGNFSLGLVVCSGDMCKMVSAVVSKDLRVLSM